jgi:hypothetical protein
MSGAIGAVLLLYGLRITLLFASYPGYDYIAIVFGGIFSIPVLVWLRYMFLPNHADRIRRKKISYERKERRKPSLFNEMVDHAKKATEPPPRKIRVFAHFRKKDFPIVASTMKDFCEALEHQTALPIERQLLRFQDEDLNIDLTKKLDLHYGLDNGSRVYVYNRGGYRTHDSPVKKQYEDLTADFNAKLNEATEQLKAKEQEQPWLDPNYGRLSWKTSFREEKRANSPNKPTSPRGGGRRATSPGGGSKSGGSKISFNV